MEMSMVRSWLTMLGFMTIMGLWLPTIAQAQEGTDYKYYFEAYGVEVLNNPGVEIEYPTRARPNPEQNITDLSYWVNDVLPYAEDRDEDRYIVYPKHGIVVPVLTPNATDQKLIDQGEMFNHYPYLEEGALHYFGYDPHQWIGNMVIAGHSSFNKSAGGNYKTTFQALPISKAGEKIFVYLKNSKGTFDFYEYTISDSFRTNRFNVSIMEHTPDEYTLTTYGCYVIWSNEERWVNVAKMTSKKFAQSDLSVESMHASADDKPASLVGETVATNTISKQMMARAVSNAYENKITTAPWTTRLTIAQKISARLATQARDAQEAVTVPEEVKAVEHSSAGETTTQPTVFSAAEIIASLLRPKMSLHQEIIIDARARQTIATRSPVQLQEFISQLETKKENLVGKTDKVSLWKDVIISHLLSKLTPSK